MKKFLSSLLFLLSLSSFASTGSFYEVKDKESIIKYENQIFVYNSIIDWDSQKIKINCKTLKKIDSGAELLSTYTSLKELAVKRAAEIIDDINIDCKYRVKDYKALNSNAAKKISKVLSGVAETEKSYKADIVSYTVSVNMSGSDSLISLFIADYMPQYFNFNIFNLFFKSLYAEENTGIIIDARSININPALLPKVSTDKKDVYSPKNLDKKALEEKGSVQYIVAGSKVTEADIRKEALKQEVAALKRTGSNPKIVKAYKTNGPLQTDAVISEKDASSIENSKALKEGKVTILVDASVGGVIGRKIGDYEILALNMTKN